jgi:hypothetical protein
MEVRILLPESSAVDSWSPRKRPDAMTIGAHQVALGDFVSQVLQGTSLRDALANREFFLCARTMVEVHYIVRKALFAVRTGTGLLLPEKPAKRSTK